MRARKETFASLELIENKMLHLATPHRIDMILLALFFFFFQSLADCERAMSQGRVPSWCLPRQEIGQNFRR